MRKRIEKDVAWSDLSQHYKCLHCGNPALRMPDGTFMCNGDPDCLASMQDDDAPDDCAGEGYAVVYQADQ